MCRSATLAIAVSSTSMKVAIETMTAISHGLFGPAAERGRSALRLNFSASANRHARADRHAGRDVAIGELRVGEDDLHRHALHDLDVVAGRVLGRQRAEDAARSRLEAVDL